MLSELTIERRILEEQTSAADLGRFVCAQESVIDQALSELRAGRKKTDWMWFIFPQIDGLGSSSTAVLYSLRSRAEASA